ncbi:MAG: glutamine synthetase III, partial [Prevotella sp.]|nr:glutamine synthetase III [Prevotella sp.]
MEALRFQVVGEAFKKKPLDVKSPSERPYEYFGKKVFKRHKMYKYLPTDVYEMMIDVIDNGARLDRNVADA